MRKKISHDRKEDLLHYFKIILTILGIAFVILACYAAFQFGQMIFSNSTMTNSVQEPRSYTISIEKGDTPLSIGTELEKAGIIESRLAFVAQAYLYDCSFGPGEYLVESNQSSKEIAKSLSVAYKKSLEEEE